ncbi:hypothetical protein Goshw_015807, partial [Gossypium schwendimanii]|nr:hypothetical protein [Gossypium schwendimanii]
ELCPLIKNVLLLDSEGKRIAVKYYSDDWPTNSAKEAFEKAVFAKTQKTNARTDGKILLLHYDFSVNGFPSIVFVEGRSVSLWETSSGSVARGVGEPFNGGGIVLGVSMLDAEITMFDNYVVVYKFVQDLHFFVTGGENENEIILAAVLQGFFDAVYVLDMDMCLIWCMFLQDFHENEQFGHRHRYFMKSRNNVVVMPNFGFAPLVLTTLCFRGTVDKKEALENLDLILLCLDEIVDGGIILETDANVIAGKVASHSMDAGAPLSEQTITQALATAREHLTRSLLK